MQILYPRVKLNDIDRISMKWKRMKILHLLVGLRSFCLMYNYNINECTNESSIICIRGNLDVHGTVV